MTQLTDEIRELIDRADEAERRVALQYLRRQLPLHPLEEEWGTTAEAIMIAIARSSDLTQRGIRGILAEATFEGMILPQMTKAGWKPVTIVGHQNYDFLLQSATKRVRIQVKMQRRERGAPKEFAARSRAALSCPARRMYVVEVQKTRGGERRGQQTRPYHFSDFDILAVNLQASTGNWQRFLYTVANWLLPRPKKGKLIAIMQPVPDRADEYWTDELGSCIQWFLSGNRKQLYSRTR